MQGRSSGNFQGIDISHYDTGIALNDIIAKGKKTVYMKASEGTNNIDSTFRQFNPALRALGLKTGAFHLFHFYRTPTVTDQVTNFLNQIRGQTLDCALALDCAQSGWHDSLNPAAVTTQALDFAGRVKAATGADVVFYANTYFIKDHFTADIKALPAWIGDTRDPDAPGENGLIESWVGFRFSSTGSVGGKAVNFDEFTQAILLKGPFNYGNFPPTPITTPAPIGSKTVSAYQHKLNAVRIHDGAGYALAEDGIDGPKTKQAVIRLEKLMKLTVDGGAWGQQCESACAQLAATKPVLKPGSTGSFVNYFQYRLGVLETDGIYGDLTVKEVKGYQAAHKLSVDGEVGVKTWESLME